MKTTVLPDGSTLKPGEVIYRMQRPLHGQTVNLRSGPASRYISVGQLRQMIKLEMDAEMKLEALKPQPDGFVGGKSYCSASAICRAHPDIPYATASTALRQGDIKKVRAVTINGRPHVHVGDVAAAISQIKKL